MGRWKRKEILLISFLYIALSFGHWPGIKGCQTTHHLVSNITLDFFIILIHYNVEHCDILEIVTSLMASLVTLVCHRNCCRCWCHEQPLERCGVEPNSSAQALYGKKR
jgi:hypothetical protein